MQVKKVMADASEKDATDTDGDSAATDGSPAKANRRPVRKAAAKKTTRRKPRGKKPVANTDAEKPIARPIVLEARPGIHNVAAMQEEMAKVLQAEGPITVDVGTLKSLDIAALQLIVAFANSARAQARSLDWQGPVDTLMEFSRLADLNQYLDVNTAQDEQQDDGLCPVF